MIRCHKILNTLLFSVVLELSGSLLAACVCIRCACWDLVRKLLSSPILYGLLYVFF